MINPYQKYTYEIRDPPSKSNLPKTLTCFIVAKGGTPLANVDLGGFWFLKAFSNGCQNATQVSFTHKDPIKIGYLLPLFKLVGGMS